MDKQIIDNTVAITRGVGETTLERLLGEAGVKQYADVALHNADKFQVVSAHILVNYCKQKGKSSLEIGAYQEAIADFQNFFVECARISAEKQRGADKPLSV